MKKNSLRSFIALGAVATALGSSATASANGRYPQAMQFAEDPSDAERIWLMSTYGMLTSPDRGKTWHWICEQALGISTSVPFDPTFGIHENGTIIMGLTAGLRSTKTRGCDWKQAIPEVADSFVMDVSVDPALKSRGLVLVSFGVAGDGGGTVYTNQLWETTDNGETFHLLAGNLPDDVYSTTMDAAPSDPQRLYISAQALNPNGLDTTPLLLRSRDRGKTWQRLPVPMKIPGGASYIAAVHRTNPDILYLRTLEFVEGVADRRAESSLLYTTNGGDTWQELFRGEAPMLGFALAPDGSEVFIGFGDPGDRATTTDPAKLGLWRASTADFRFEKRFDHTIACLSHSSRGLYACSRLDPAGFDLGLSKDGGRTFETVQNRRRIQGPAPCAAGTAVAGQCTAEVWQATCDTVLACEAVESEPRPADEDEDDGCGCRTAGRPGSTVGSVLAVFGAAALGLGRMLRKNKRQ
jgi:MYXO-CTERM domain-containing protein